MDELKYPSRRDAIGQLCKVPLALAAVAATAQSIGQTRARDTSVDPRSEASKQPTPRMTPPLAIVSRHLQWAKVEEAIEVAKEAGFPGIAWTVRGGAHIEPAEVEKELPRVVKLTEQAGLATPMIITNIGDVNAVRIEAILATMQSLGIQRYRAAAPRYVYDADFPTQYDAFRAKLVELAKLNERYGMTAMFHTHSYANTIGGSGWDLWMLLKDLDPRYIGINYDIGHITAKGGAGWMESSRAAHTHIKAVSVKDFLWRKRNDVAPDTWPWYTEFVHPGQGMVNFTDFFRTLYAFGFDGPVETYFEYKVDVPGRSTPFDMLGTNYREWKLNIPKTEFVSYLKRDVEFYKTHLKRAGYAV